MKLKVLFFGGLKREAGASERWIELPEGAAMGDLLAKLKAEQPQLASQLEVTAVAVGDRVVNEGYELQDGEEVALLPPVSGG
jgi:molybdopterin converting factor subunit 1